MEPNPQTLPELRTQILLRFLIVMLLPFQIMGQAAIDFPYSASGNNFIRNNGQLTDMNGELADNVLFYAEYPYMDVFITTSGLTMLLLEPSLNEFQEKIYHWERVDIKLENALILENPRDVGTLVDAINSVLRNENVGHQISVAAKEFAARHLWSAIARKQEVIYTAVCDR